jgi:hypothetical protein
MAAATALATMSVLFLIVSIELLTVLLVRHIERTMRFNVSRGPAPPVQ